MSLPLTLRMILMLVGSYCLLFGAMRFLNLSAISVIATAGIGVALSAWEGVTGRKHGASARIATGMIGANLIAIGLSFALVARELAFSALTQKPVELHWSGLFFFSSLIGAKLGVMFAEHREKSQDATLKPGVADVQKPPSELPMNEVPAIDSFPKLND